MTNTKLKESSETLSMLITLEIHRNLPIADRALKLRKCAKSIYRKTKTKVIKEAMHQIRNSKNDKGIVDAMESVSANWDNIIDK